MRRIFAVLPVLLALAVLLGSCTAPTACMEEATAFRAALLQRGRLQLPRRRSQRITATIYDDLYAPMPV